jgi:carboxyl-terminal processing protease
MQKSLLHTSKVLGTLVLSALALAAAPDAQATAKPKAPTAATTRVATPLAAYDRAAELVQESYYDAARLTRADGPWKQLVAEHRKSLAAAKHGAVDDDHLKGAVAALLADAGAQGTGLLTDADQDYWALRSAFSGELAGAPVRHPGAFFERRGKRWFVRSVLPGSPADDAGLLRGDEIIAVDGRPLSPVRSFSSLKAGEKAHVEIRRTPMEAPRRLDVGTVHESWQQSLLRGMQASQRFIKVEGRTIGYVWLPAATSDEFRSALHAAAQTFETKADALVLDLRGGVGGADLAYLEPFFALPDPKGQPQKPTYSKPLVALVDDRTSGGREWLAWLLKRRGRATVIGEPTAGAFLARRLIDVGPGERFALQLPVAGGKGLGGQLEGHPVVPDVAVDAPLMYAAGVDEALTLGLKRLGTPDRS